jgi:probable addiction module antidote protein
MSKEEFSRYDSADYLQTDADIAEYLAAVMEEEGDDPAYIARALGVVARAQNMSQLARETGLSREGLVRALSGQGNPTMTTMAKVAKALGLRIELRPTG